MLGQKAVGFALLLISAAIFVMLLHGETLEERDATPLLFFVPLGLYLLFTKRYVISG